jgi:hypothetical protein
LRELLSKGQDMVLNVKGVPVRALHTPTERLHCDIDTAESPRVLASFLPCSIAPSTIATATRMSSNFEVNSETTSGGSNMAGFLAIISVVSCLSQDIERSYPAALTVARTRWRV